MDQGGRAGARMGSSPLTGSGTMALASSMTQMGCQVSWEQRYLLLHPLSLGHTNPLPQTSHRSLRSDGHRERGAWWIFTSAKSVQDVSVRMALKDILVVQGEGNSPMEMQSSTCWYSYGWALGAVVFFSCNAKERFTSSWKPSDCKWPLRSGQDSLRVAKMTALSTVLQPGGYITGKSIVFKNWPLTAETGVFNYFCNRPCFQNTTATNWFFF